MSESILHSLFTKNYKNLYFKEFVSIRKLNLLIGSNGSGKSNFISVLKFLKNCLIVNIHEANQGVTEFQAAISKMGHDKILDYNLTSPNLVKFTYRFSLCWTNEVTNEAKSDIVSLDLRISVDRENNRVGNFEECLFTVEENRELDPYFGIYYYVFEVDKGYILVHDNVEQDLPSHTEPIHNISAKHLGLAILPKLLENFRYPPNLVPAYQIRRQLIEFVLKWRFYNANEMNLEQIRTSEPKIGGNDIYLSASGENLALVLENLIQQDIDFEDIINKAMKSILPKTRRIKPIRSGRLSLTVAWYFEDSKESFYLSEMSDGTVRMLCWPTILHSPVLPSLLVIDEPELGLHVSWMRILAEWIKEASTKTQVIITTHSPDLLDHFTDCLENVYCFYSENQSHFSMKPLSQEMLADKLEEGWQLGDLYRVGDPSVGGWPW